MKTNRIVVLRFSAMGDVAMAASVLNELVRQHPALEIVMVSKKTFAPFFEKIEQVRFHNFKPQEKHRGFWGLIKLYKELKAYKPNAVADLHDNIRSRIISLFFRLAFIKIKRLNKGRKEKKALTRKKNKILIQLKPTVERYADVFKKLGYPIILKHQLEKKTLPIPQNADLFFNSTKKKIGISPFAQHTYKIYPIEKMELVIKQLNKTTYEILLFGNGAFEKNITEQWESKFANVHSLIGKFNLSEELAIISNLDLMLSMDSAGMHLASLMGVAVISIWGPTHPYAGFMGYGQSLNDCLHIQTLNRPNSIYGNKPCLCGNIPCINLITPEVIVNKINEKLHA